ncbi:MAG: 16S rRNA (adenine(1518)-N(6)/adenine(1519)-N(6))-dimethyltransferase RsmA [Oscillospiraceae bacterium]|jgi:16S rRNA (adenine1518-N6/adenine1519-N6)-dimethyltransferase|nr:16S rRNA (adenine(1518)-N(6)/adenine(1519)-N(6))-dimethyltransferase RsmA [Oscillospiraceae bacterium]
MPPDYLATLRRHGFTFSKAKGQNFIVNPSVCPRMAASSGAAENDGVLEIGPGAGALTRALSDAAGKVVAVEIDARLIPVLEETLAGRGNVAVIQGDIMQVDLQSLLREQFGNMPVRVCANLPYYITSPVLMRLLESRLPFVNITVMAQKEAADRLCAQMGTRACGAVTAAVAYYAEARQLFGVSRGSFFPAPKVDSAVLQLKPRREPTVEVADEAFFFRVVRAAFGQRRKTIANAVSAGLPIEKPVALEAMARAGIAPEARAERLTLEDYACLTRALYALL